MKYRQVSTDLSQQSIYSKKEKTLVILIGNARGGEETWKSMYKNLLDEYNADLAICFGERKDKSASLYQRAKYIWEVPEYDNWREFYDQNFKSNWDIFLPNQKFENATLLGGIDNYTGSGAIIFAFRHYLLKYKINYINQYDRIILTRSDFYYIDKHPLLPLGKLYAVEGEEYGGVSDRHFIFDSYMSKDVLGILDFLINENNLEMLKNIPDNSINPETALMLYFKHNKIYEKLLFHERVQFTVAVEGDLSRWNKPSGHIVGFKGLKYKYMKEYEVALQNLIKKKGIISNGSFLLLTHFINKIFFTKGGFLFLIQLTKNSIKKIIKNITP